MSAPLAVVDSGGANLGSVLVALERIGAPHRLTTDSDAIQAAPGVILPGVGAADVVMARIRSLGLVPVLQALSRPLLGICVGMQVLYERSAEGDVAGLGLLPGSVERLQPSPGIAVPHMGWNSLEALHPEDPLLAGLTAQPAAYFVHSYAVPVGPDTLAASLHGSRFTAICRRGRIMGAQFHPERSAETGRRLLGNFARLCLEA